MAWNIKSERLAHINNWKDICCRFCGFTKAVVRTSYVQRAWYVPGTYGRYPKLDPLTSFFIFENKSYFMGPIWFFLFFSFSFHIYWCRRRRQSPPRRRELQLPTANLIFTTCVVRQYVPGTYGNDQVVVRTRYVPIKLWWWYVPVTYPFPFCCKSYDSRTIPARHPYVPT